MLRMVCNGLEIEPVLQDITREELNRGAHTAPDARLDIVARGFWERQRSPFFDVRICHPNADSYRDKDLNQIYWQHETEKKCQYANPILEVEQATFTPLDFSTTGGMEVECKRYHSRLDELVATKISNGIYWQQIPTTETPCSAAPLTHSDRVLESTGCNTFTMWKAKSKRSQKSDGGNRSNAGNSHGESAKETMLTEMRECG